MTDPADNDTTCANEFCGCRPDPAGIELPGGWTLVAPPGTSQAATEYAAQKLDDDDYLPSVDDAEEAVEEAARQAERDAIGPMHGPPTEHQHFINEMLVETMGRLLGPSPLMDHLFQEQPKAQKFGTVVYDTDTIPSSKDSWVKTRFMDQPASRHFTYDEIQHWTEDINNNADELMYGGTVIRDRVTEPAYGHIAVAGDGGVLHHYASYVDADGKVYRDFSAVPELAALTEQWAQNPPARPGWTGSVTGRPRPIPLKPSPWQALPKAMHDGNRTLIIEPGADNNPHARLTDLHGNDLGPAFPNGLRPAYTGKPAPIPWDSPLADPIADMRRAVEEDQ